MNTAFTRAMEHKKVAAFIKEGGDLLLVVAALEE